MSTSLGPSRHHLRLPTRIAGQLAVVTCVAAGVLFSVGARGEQARPAAASPSGITAPRLSVAPHLDGLCTDPSYASGGLLTLTNSAGKATAAVRVVHSGLAAYACATGLPAEAGQQLILRVNEPSGGAAASSPTGPAGAVQQFSITAGGAISGTQLNANGGTTVLPLTGDDAGMTAQAPDGTWSAELRVSLEWLGGYARTDRMQVSVVDARGAVVARWPGTTAPAGEQTAWGTLELAPLYAPSVSAGSAFLDGRDGYLVVPSAPALTPREITLEAWVRVVGDSCGTLVGTGRLTSYWLALCHGMEFGSGGLNAIRRAQTPLGPGWHHVAVTMDADGLRTFYLDGQVDAHPDWRPIEDPRKGEVEEAPPRLGLSTLPVRIGSDRDAPAGQNYLHGYISELRLWNRVRTAAEIRGAAFTRLSGHEAGLVGLWPLTTGLQDIAGGHDAGLVGHAALAHEAPALTTFVHSAPRPLPAYRYPHPAPLAAWTPRVPLLTNAALTVDGVCRPEEYRGAAHLRLEPNRALAMKVALTADALYLCTGVLFGANTAHSAVTLFIDRSGQGGRVPTAADLRLSLTPDNRLTIAAGNGRTFSGASPGVAGSAVISSSTISNTQFALQEDVRAVAAPWWSGELRVPLAALGPFKPGDRLRFAVLFQSDLSQGVQQSVVSRLREGRLLQGRWPAAFTAQRPSTWGRATTGEPATAPDLTISLGSAADGAPGAPPPTAQLQALRRAVPRTRLLVQTAGQTRRALADGPVSSPTSDDFDANCPWWGGPAYVVDSEAKWPMVDPDHHPVVWAEGQLTSIGISNEDSPFIHSSHDVDMTITPAANSRWLVLAGGADQVLETESGAFPAAAHPLPDDHITVVGRWIFDCGHAAKTEIHPLPMFESDRLQAWPVRAGQPAQDVRVVRVWMNSSPSTFHYLLDGPFSFNVDVPTLGLHPFLSVLTGDAGAVSVTLDGAVAHVRVTPPASTGSFFWEMVLGSADNPFAPFTPATSSQGQFTVVLDTIRILDDHDGGLPDCNGLHDCGEWFMNANINGVGANIFWNASLCDCADGPYPLNRTFRVLGGDLNLHVDGYEDDDPFAGDGITTGDWDLGSLPSLCCGVEQTFQPGSDWLLSYHVVKGGVVPLALADTSFWNARLKDEPNDQSGMETDLGTLAVPGQGQPALVTNRATHLARSPLRHGGVTLLGSDVDRYDATFADFADVSLGPLPAGVTATLKPVAGWYGSLPPSVQKKLGHREERIRVTTTQGGDVPYTLAIRRTWHSIPPDWGVALDHPGTGRPVDLVTPDPAAQVSKAGTYAPQSRQLIKPWAWQHLAGEVQYYDVRIPPLTRPPATRVGQAACDLDVPGKLEVQAEGMRLVVSSAGATGDDTLSLEQLSTRFPTGHVLVQVKNRSGQGRGVYQFSASWNDAHYYDPQTCALLHGLAAAKQRIDKLTLALAVAPLVVNPGDPGPDATTDEVQIAPGIQQQIQASQFGGYAALRLSSGQVLNTAIATPAGQPVSARLYDEQGVLLGESTIVAAPGARRGAGLTLQAQLRVTGLTAGRAYLLEIVPLYALGTASEQTIPVELGTITRPA